jgi:hypothetical protein
VNNLGDQDPANPVLRLHRGLLGYAATAGFDAAYDLLPDAAGLRAMIADPATPAGTRLALADKLEKVTERLRADAPNTRRPGADPMAHYLDPTGCRLNTGGPASTRTQRRLCERTGPTSVPRGTECKETRVRNLRQQTSNVGPLLYDSGCPAPAKWL